MKKKNSIPFIFSVKVLASMKQRLWSPCSSIFFAFVFKLFHKSHSSVTWTGRAGRVWAASLSHSTLWCPCTPLPKGKQKGKMMLKQWKKDFLPENISWGGWKGDQDSFVLRGLTMSMSLTCCKDWAGTSSSQRLKGEHGGQPLLSETGDTPASEAAPTLCQFVIYQRFREPLGVS